MKVQATDGLKRRARKMKAMGSGTDKYGRSTGTKSTRSTSTGNFNSPDGPSRSKKVAKKRNKIDEIGDARIVWHKRKKRDGQNYSEGRLSKAKKWGSHLVRRKRDRLESESPDKVGEGYRKKRKMQSRRRNAGIDSLGISQKANKGRKAVNAHSQAMFKKAMAAKRRRA